MLDEALKQVAVIGAAGKMGSGISLVLLQEIAHAEAAASGRISGEPRLWLIDSNEEALLGLRAYLSAQLRRYAEKNIVALRSAFAEDEALTDNAEIIDAFVEGALKCARMHGDLHKVNRAQLVFEAIVEDVAVKTETYKQVRSQCGPETYFLTNTSSIPLGELDARAGLEGRIIGFHFYNPAPVQRLVEVICSAATVGPLRELAIELGKRLGKTLVMSKDVAGFIGNGHFMRELQHAAEQVADLGASMPDYQAVYLLNRVTQDWLVRPMGIFQLADYVGLDVCQNILRVMDTFIGDEELHCPLVDAFLDAGVRGGQFADGSQKDGVFAYERGRPAGVYSLSEGRYVAFGDAWLAEADAALGPLPEGHMAWRALARDRAAVEKLRPYFRALRAAETQGAQLARTYLRRSREIAQQLVDAGVAASPDDVTTVLTSGFYHLYGPANDLLWEG